MSKGTYSNGGISAIGSLGIQETHMVEANSFIFDSTMKQRQRTVWSESSLGAF